MKLGAGESEHAQIHRKDYVQTNPCEMQLPTALEEILTQKN